MIMFDIAEWIANFLILGIGVCFWAGAIFMVAMLVSLFSQWIEEWTENEST